MSNAFGHQAKTPDATKKTRRANSRDARKERAQAEAAERQAKSDQLSVVEKLAKLDLCFGPGQGATKERAKLQAKLQQEQELLQKKAAVVEASEGVDSNTELKSKKGSHKKSKNPRRDR